MISDPVVNVCCDGTGCCETEVIDPEFRYGGVMHAKGEYDCSDKAIEEKLKEKGWVCRDGKQFCSSSCSGTSK